MQTDGRDEKLSTEVPAVETATPVDPWAEAFDALADNAPEPTDGDTPAAEPGEPRTDGDPDAPAAVPAEPADAPVGSDDVGGSLPADGEVGEADAGFDPGTVEETIKQYTSEIEERAISEVAQMFLDRVDDQGRKLIRQNNGLLGATINDPDIYRVDPNTGVATFYNPDTQRPFSGDNPRAQAKAWVEAYNEDLRDTFNRVAEQRSQELSKEAAPVIELLRFTPTYEKLDPVRKQMFDALIEGYEVYDSENNHIGYSVDLNAALNQVNRQVAALQANRERIQQKPPTGPAVDMPVSGSGNASMGKEIKSIAEAMEALQDAQLEKLNKR